MRLSQNPPPVGIDVGKKELVLAVAGEPHVLTFVNDARGIAQICRLLQGRATRVIFEATGGYEWDLWEALAQAGIDARQVSPAQVRAFARAQGTAAKTDALDAHLIAQFAVFRPDAGRSLQHESLRNIRDLITLRRARVTDLVRLRGRADRLRGGTPKQFEQDLLQAQITSLDQKIAQAIGRSDALARKDRLLRSIPGVGGVLSATLLAEMPELGALTSGRAAALTGTAPIARDSGQWRGQRFIGGGRKVVRDVLWMGAITAARHNPDLSAFYARLRHRGLPAKKAIIAVARKLIELANAVLKRQTPWKRQTI